MPTIKTDLEVRLYNALRRITRYEPPDRLRRTCEKEYGLGFEETLEMAYDNIQAEARDAIKGIRQVKPTPAAQRPASSSPRMEGAQ